MSSIKDVAAHAGVSIGTVSNTLNKPDSVSDATRRRVQSAIDELGYIRNQSASQLRSGRSNTIALVVLDAANPFFVDVATGADREAADEGQLVITCDAAGDVARERRYLTMLEEQRVRGVLITPVDDADRSALVDMSRRGTPVVLVDRGAAGAPLCSVAVDDVMGGRLAAQHLTDLGHRRTAFIGGPASIMQVADRRRGFTDVVDANGGTVTTVSTPSLTAAAGAHAVGELLAGPEQPTAVFCANDLLALGAMQALAAADVHVPEEMSVVGYDDIDYAASAVTPLTSVRQPRIELGRAAARLLREELDEGDGHRHRHVVFEPELIARHSTSNPPI